MCSGDKVRRLAVDATLRAAAPYQKSRRKRAVEENRRERRVYVEKPDMRRCQTNATHASCYVLLQAGTSDSSLRLVISNLLGHCFISIIIQRWSLLPDISTNYLSNGDSMYQMDHICGIEKTLRHLLLLYTFCL